MLRQDWLRPRDPGYAYERGLIRLVGRTREVIIVNPLVVHADPVEQVLTNHADVDAAYPVARPKDHGARRAR